MKYKNKKHTTRELSGDHNTSNKEDFAKLAAPNVFIDSSHSKSKMTKLIIFIVVAVLLIVATTVIAYLLLSDKNSGKVTGVQTPVEFATTNELVSNAVSKLDGSLLHNAYMDGLGGKTTNGFGTYGVAEYKVGERKFNNLPAESFGYGYVGNSDTASSDYTKLVDFFIQHHYRKVNSGNNQPGKIVLNSEDIEYVSFATYESDNDLCMIWHADASSTPLGNHIASIGCATKNSYKVAAKALDTYYSAYVKSVSNPSSDIVLGVSAIEEGDDGYKHALIFQNDPSESEQQFIGHYYKEPAKKEWTYLTGSYEPLLCSDFNTDVLKKSFKGVECLSGPSGEITTL